MDEKEFRRTTTPGRKRPAGEVASSSSSVSAKRRKVKLYVTVGATGFTTGDTLYGYANETDRGNVTHRIVLKVVQGGQPAHQDVVNLFVAEDLVRMYAKKFNMSFSVAQKQMDRIRGEMVEVNDNALPIGSSCPGRSGEHDVGGDCACEMLARFQILQPGRWREFAEEVGMEERLMEYVANQTALTWRDILQLMGKHTLVLRAVLFEIATDVIESVPNGIEGSIMCTFKPTNPGTRSFRITEGVVVTVDASRSGDVAQFSKENCILLTKRALIQHEDYESVEFQRELEQLDRAYDSLASLTIGGWKSALQKVIRFSPERVHLFSSSSTVNTTLDTLDAGVYAALICSMIMLHRGGFVPDLQTYARGNTSALKRAAVILLEDSWAGSTRRLVGYLGVALVCQLMQSYQPSNACMRACVYDMFRAAKSNRIVDWRSMAKLYNVRNREPHGAAKVTTSDLKPASIKSLEDSDRLLRILKSFKGDMDMFTTAAKYARQNGKLRFIDLADPSAKPQLMPDCHMIDQHAYPGIGHVLDTRRAANLRVLDTFAFRFRTFIFQNVTGINPRLHDTRAFEQRDNVKQVRFAQKMVMRFVAKVESPLLKPLPIISTRRNMPYALDAGVLSAGVGPIEVRIDRLVLLVILGVNLPHEEVVMLKPGRSARDNLNWGKTPGDEAKVEQQKQQAIEKAREKAHNVRSPLLPNGKQATFRDGEWCFDGVRWLKLIGAVQDDDDGKSSRMEVEDDVTTSTLGLDIDIHDPPSWWDDGDGGGRVQHNVLRDESAIVDALSTRGDGFVRNAEQIVRGLCEAVGTHTVMRVKYLLHQKYENLKMPVPSRGGGLAPDQLLAMPGDWDVYRFFVLLSRVVPGALRPQVAPRFSIPNAILIQMVSNWISEWLSERNNTTERQWSTERFSETPFTSSSEWNAVQSELQNILKPHQRDAVQMMHQRARSGHNAHFLVMDTGAGKTFTAMSYLLSRLRTSALSQNVKRIIWVTPVGVKNTLIHDQLRKLASLRLLREQGIANPVPLDQRALKVPVPISVVKSAKDFRDWSINMISQDALRRKDISEKLYELAVSSAVVFDEVDQSYGASLRTSHALRLAGLCVEFVAMTATPIPASNQLDRAADWLGMTENYPINRKNYLVAATAMVSLRASLNIQRVYEEVKVAQTDKAQRAFKQYQLNREWRTLAMTLIADTTPAMCDKAVEMAQADIRGGGCLVVCDNQRHIELARDYLRHNHPDVTHGEHGALRDERVNLVFVVKNNDRGYDAIRLGAMVRQPYAGSVASRIQMEGRLPRIGQRRSVINYAVVFMENTMMHLLYERQEAQDTINYSLEQLALEYEQDLSFV